MARSGPVLPLAAAAVALAVAACTYTFDVPDTAQIACADGGAPCPDGWDCDISAGRCVVHGSVPEIPEIRVNPSTPITTSEDGGTASLAVRLGATPTAPVRLLIASSRVTEAAVFPPELTFTGSDWNQPQIVTVQGARDSVVDGDQAYEVVLGPPVTSDARFASLPEIRIPGTNANSDTAALVAVPTTFTTSESDTPSTPTPVGVFLSSRPSGVVMVPVASLDESEGTVSPAQLAFDAGNWNTPQTIRVTGVDDESNPIADGRHAYTVRLGPATSADSHFQGATADLAGFNDDNDSPGVRLTYASGMQVSEPTYGSSFYVSLFTQPTADVTLHFTSLNANQVTIEPATATLAFDAGNWSSYQYVNLLPVDDPYDDPLEYTPWTIQSSNAVSADPNYSGLDVGDATGVTYDDEIPGLHFDGSTYGYLDTDENGAPRTFTVTLTARPYGQVTIRPASANSSRVLVSPSTITLDPGTWSTGAPMTITPVDNQAREYDSPVDITFSVTASLPSQDPGYQNLMVYPFNVNLRDDERIIFTLSTPRSGDMTDPGGTYFILDSLCYFDPQYAQLFNPVAALLAVDEPNLGMQRIASLSPNLGDGQQSWVLTAGRNYLSETRTGPVIGRANSRNLFDFPLARALSTIGGYWTGLNADWTSAPNNCGQWTLGMASSGRDGASGATGNSAISLGNPPCDVPHRLLCVEQY